MRCFLGWELIATAIMLNRMEARLGDVLSFNCSRYGIISWIISFLVGLFTLRLKSHFFAMLTMAVSGLFLVLQRNGEH